VWWRPTVLTVGYSALAALTALALVGYGAYDCYEECRYDLSNPPWAYDSSAWQWDAILWLGVVSGIASIAFVVTVFRFGAGVAVMVLAAQLSVSAAGAFLVLAAHEASPSAVAVVLGGLTALGCGVIAARRTLRGR
jgi:hypothetical protein